MKTLTTDEFAALFAVTSKTVNLWIASGMPVATKGARGRGKRTRIDLQAATQWYFRKNFERLELDRARTQLASEQARKLSMENRTRLRELGERAVWNREVGKLLAEMRDDLVRFPNVAPMLHGTVHQRRDTLETVVYGLLNKWSLYADSASRGKSRR